MSYRRNTSVSAGGANPVLINLYCQLLFMDHLRRSKKWPLMLPNWATRCVRPIGDGEMAMGLSDWLIVGLYALLAQASAGLPLLPFEQRTIHRK